MSFNVFLVSCIDLIWFVFLLGTFCSISHNRNTCVQKRALDSGWLQLLSWVFKQCSRCFSMKQLITTMDSVFLFRQSGVPLFRTTCRFEVKKLYMVCSQRDHVVFCVCLFFGAKQTIAV